MVSIRNPIKILSANSTLSWSDPTGLAPEKEKKRDRVQSTLLNPVYQGEELLFYASIDELGGYFRSLMTTSKAEWEAMGVDFSGGVSSGNGSGGTREGEGTNGSGNTAENGQGNVSSSSDPEETIPLDDNTKDEIINTFKFSYNGNCEDTPQPLIELYFEALWEGYGENISIEDYNFLMSTDHTVNFHSDDNWAVALEMVNSDDKTGLAYTTGHSFDFQVSLFANNADRGVYNINHDKNNAKYYKTDIPTMVMHEMGHSFADWKIGSQYNTWNEIFKENWAYWFVNTRYRERKSLPTQEYRWGILQIFFKGQNP